MKGNLTRTVLVLIVVFLSLPAIKGYAQNNVFGNAEELLQINNSAVYEDRSGRMDFDDIQRSNFKPIRDAIFNFGITSSKIWIRFSVQNLSEEKELYLMVAQPVIDYAALFERSSGKAWHSKQLGEYKPFDKRFEANPNYIFPIGIPKDSTGHFFLQISSLDQIQFPVYIGTKDSIMDWSSNKAGLMGIYTGIVLIMIAYNFFLFLAVKDSSYIYYIVFILFVGLVQLNFKGYCFQYLWPQCPWLAINSTYILPLCSALSTALFVWEFLMVKLYAPKFGKGVLIYSAMCCIGAFLGITGFRVLGVQILQSSAFLGSIYVLLLANSIRRKGYRPAFFFIIGFASFLLSIILFVLTNFNVLPSNFFTANILEFGSVAQILLLSFALADRINTYRKEKEASQAEALRVSRENARIIQEQNQLLEIEVDKRTEALQVANTELKEAFRNLKQAQTQLVEFEKMASLGMLTAGIAHEINNPINFVTANVNPIKRDVQEIIQILKAIEELALKDMDPQEKRAEIAQIKMRFEFDYLQEEINFLLKGVQEGARRTAEIVKSLRVFSRVDEEDIKLADLNLGIESTLVILRSSFKDKIKVETHFSPLPMVECYPGKLNQVFLNLLNNAAYAIKEKFDDKHGGHLVITTSFDEKQVMLSFKDNGSGIAEEIKDKIFEPFFTTKDVGEGTGLGLSIVFQIVKKHNGTIHLDSVVNEGTEFVIYLPIKQTEMNG